MSKNYYPEMIDALRPYAGNINAIFDWLMKHEPYAIVRAARAIKRSLSITETEPLYIEECRALIRSHDSIVPAVSHWRAETGQGFREAKEAIDILREAMS